MEIEEALRAYLLIFNVKITPDEFTALPAITYTKVSDVKSHTLTGQSTLERPMIQFAAYASTKSEARTIANQIKTALCDYTGTLSGIFIQKIELQNELSNLENIETKRVFIEVLEFEVNYERN